MLVVAGRPKREKEVLVVVMVGCMKRKRALPKKEVEEGDKTSGYNSTEKKIMMMMGAGYDSIPSLFAFQGPDSTLESATVQCAGEGARLEEETVKSE